MNNWGIFTPLSSNSLKNCEKLGDSIVCMFIASGGTGLIVH